MRRFRPLPQTHPEFSVSESTGFKEYRVESWCLARDGTGRKIKRTSDLNWQDALFPLFLSVLWVNVITSFWARVFVSLLSLYVVWQRCTQVLFESVIVIPPYGIQLETHRGLPSWPLLVSKTFIPSNALLDFVINEGLSGWNVRYYLAAIKTSSSGVIRLHVAYENILPHLPVLTEVYRDVQDILFPSTTSTLENATA